MALEPAEKYIDLSAMPQYGIILANATNQELIPKTTGTAHILIVSRKSSNIDIRFVVVYDVWSTEITVIGGSVSGGITLSKDAGSDTIKATNTKGTGIPYLLL